MQGHVIQRAHSTMNLSLPFCFQLGMEKMVELNVIATCNMFYDKNGHARTMFYLYFLLILISLGNEFFWCYCLTPGDIGFMIDIICSKNEINSHLEL